MWQEILANDQDLHKLKSVHSSDFSENTWFDALPILRTFLTKNISSTRLLNYLLPITSITFVIPNRSETNQPNSQIITNIY